MATVNILIALGLFLLSNSGPVTAQHHHVENRGNLSPADVVFLVITGSVNHRARADGVNQTWCSTVHCVFFSDTVRL